jgi:Ser/Thr protein kinase RdoA (MazF antagonist)
MSSGFAALSSQEQIDSLMPLVQEIIDGYNLGECTIESINHEYNSTFKVVCPNGKLFALRVNVNSGRNLEQLNAELFFVNHLLSHSNLTLPRPVLNAAGSAVSTVFHEHLNKDLHAVLFTWLKGTEPGDEPSVEQAYAAGRVLAQLHLATDGLPLAALTSLEVLDQPLWGTPDLISNSGFATPQQRQLLTRMLERISVVLEELYVGNAPQLIHADVHPWNLMWHEGQMAVFDFDDCAIGLAVQDLAVTMYYLEEKPLIKAMLKGYQSLRALPQVADSVYETLLLQRRLYLLNYLHETTNPEHREMIPKYLLETVRRIEAYFAKEESRG